MYFNKSQFENFTATVTNVASEMTSAVGARMNHIGDVIVCFLVCYIVLSTVVKVTVRLGHALYLLEGTDTALTTSAQVDLSDNCSDTEQSSTDVSSSCAGSCDYSSGSVSVSQPCSSNSRSNTCSNSRSNNYSNSRSNTCSNSDSCCSSLTKSSSASRSLNKFNQSPLHWDWDVQRSDEKIDLSNDYGIDTDNARSYDWSDTTMPKRRYRTRNFDNQVFM